MQGTLLRSLLSGQTAYLQARHAVLTGNLANADTPDFLPKDIKTPDFAELVERAARKGLPMTLDRTSNRHFEGTSFRQLDAGERDVDGFEIAIAGNGVVIEEQAQKLQETRLNYQMTAGIYAKVKGMMVTALGTNGA